MSRADTRQKLKAWWVPAERGREGEREGDRGVWGEWWGEVKRKGGRSRELKARRVSVRPGPYAYVRCAVAQ